jgi:hypothetical protein
MSDVTSPIGLLLAVLAAQGRRARREQGASAVEWSIIAAIGVGLVICVVAVLLGALDG